MNTSKMNSTKTITAADILEQRDASRRAGVLAHSSNQDGDFMARVGCSCYTCRDVLDPTGEEDAREQQELNRPVRLPSPIPSLRIPICPPAPARPTQCPNSPHPPPPYPEYRPYCCQTSPLHLPIPPRAHRQPSSGSNTNDLSPIVGLNSPDSFSFQFRINLRSPSLPSSRENSDGVVDVVTHLEESMIPRLTRLLSQYKALMTHIESEYEEGLSHDEMAAKDAWWDEVDGKILQTESLLALLRKV